MDENRIFALGPFSWAMRKFLSYGWSYFLWRTEQTY